MSKIFNLQFSIFNKLNFILRKPKVIIVTGEGRVCAREAIFQLLNQHFRIGSEVLIFEAAPTELEKLRFFLEKSPFSILVSTQGTMEIQDKKAGFKKMTFGFQSGVDFQATDVKLNGDTNFKINYKGNIIPVWLKGIVGKDRVYSALTAAAVGTGLGLNLVEISQSLKDYQGWLKMSAEA